MVSAYESYVVQAITGYYNYDYDMFFKYLDEGVIWFGPNEGQYIVGKDNLIKAVTSHEKKLRFHIDNMESKLISLSSSVYTLVLSYRLYSVHPNGQTRVYLQRVTVNGQKCRDQDGKFFWRCPFIQISNVVPGSENSSAAVFTTSPLSATSSEHIGSQGKRLVFPGDNHSKVYIKEDSIKYIVGGKGVFCYVHTDENVYLVRMLLKDVMEKLPDFFYRCHSSYIVNLKRVLYLSREKITLYDSTQIPISAKKYSLIKNDISNRMSENSF